MARRQGFFDDLMSIGPGQATLEGWFGSVAAGHFRGAAYRDGSAITRAPVSTNTLGGLGAVVRQGFVHVFAEFLQYIIPAGLLIGTAVGYFKRRSRSAGQRSPELRRRSRS